MSRLTRNRSRGEVPQKGTSRMGDSRGRAGALGSAGFTLVELLIAALIASILMGAVYQVLVTNQRVSIVQREQLLGHHTVRSGIGILAQELREVSAGGGDLQVIASDRVSFRALRAFGVVCAIGEDGQPSLRTMTAGRPFTEGEVLYVFADDDPETAQDDVWFSVPASNVSSGYTCGADSQPAQRIMVPGLSSAQRNRIRPGAPVRSWELVEYGVQVVSGEPYLVRVQGGETSRLVGPLSSDDGLEFVYLDENGNETAAAAQVATVRVTLRTDSDARTAEGRTIDDELTVVVALRN